MNKPLAATIFGAVAVSASYLTVQFPQYAVWFNLAGMVSAYLLRSPLFTPEVKP